MLFVIQQSAWIYTVSQLISQQINQKVKSNGLIVQGTYKAEMKHSWWLCYRKMNNLSPGLLGGQNKQINNIKLGSVYLQWQFITKIKNMIKTVIPCSLVTIV